MKYFFILANHRCVEDSFPDRSCAQRDVQRGLLEIWKNRNTIMEHLLVRLMLEREYIDSCIIPCLA
jgi:hypothetical protein